MEGVGVLRTAGVAGDSNLVGGRLDTLQLESGHGALGHSGALLQVLEGEGLVRVVAKGGIGGTGATWHLEGELATGSPDNLPLVALGVVRQPPAVSNTLDHLGAESKSETQGWLFPEKPKNSKCFV